MDFKNTLLAFVGKRKPTKHLFVLLGIVAGLLLIVGLGAEVTRGSIDIFVPERGARVVLDGKEVAVSEYENQIMTLPYIPTGTHTVAVHKDGFFSWEKTLSVRRGETAEASVFMIPENMTVEEVPLGQYNRVREIFAQNPADAVKRANKKDVQIERDGSSLIARWISAEPGVPLPFYLCPSEDACASGVTFFTATDGAVGSFDFYPRRKDVALVANNGNIYAVEIDKRPTQNIQLVYTGTRPDFAIDRTTSTMYILDNGAYYRIRFR